ncbi:coiled-coil domain-containing protein 146-like [Gadus macrocephalus]|uniref:coiled-coil domain-containing protein 146-like n=1 Tax=Gadus macrocephalus TaxID=80720 RepID=UPI0028CB33D6|nr:coiled-coil domain-containing protein 146-like [Gadus macrocephalus]
MAVAAELSMRQAQALALEQEVRERKEQVEECERRLAQGVSPGLEVEEEWRRLLRDRRRRQKEAQEREEREGEEAWNQLPGGVFTTAEPRPNAYIPSQGRLPLPRPYGAPGPFKPTEPGANMRHIRKPRFKPLEK